MPLYWTYTEDCFILAESVIQGSIFLRERGMKKLLFLICCAVASLCFQSRIVWAGQTVCSKNLTIEDVQPAILSGSLGWFRVQSAIVDMADIDLNSIKIIDLHQEGNAAIVYCNFTHKQGDKFFGYIPLVRLKNSMAWINRENGLILEK